MKILVTGGTSMVAMHLKKYLPDAVYIGSKDYDLRDYESVDQMYIDHKPEAVIHLAAKVGGIIDNIKNPVGFFEENMYINTNVLRFAHIHGIKRFIGTLSTCVYPDRFPTSFYPLTESRLHEGSPTGTNFAYGYAKRCLAVHIDSYNKQYGTNYNYVIPCNLYSEFDHFTGDRSHFVSSLIHKISTAIKKNEPNITLFGTGQPLRQFMYAEDFAKILAWQIKENNTANINVATDEVFSIEEMAKIALEACNAQHLGIVWDLSKPDGQYRKDVSTAQLKRMCPDFKCKPLNVGIQEVFYKYHHNEVVA